MQAQPTDIERKLLERIEARTTSMQKLAREWSLINTGTHNLDGLAKQLAVLQPVFAELGGDMDAVDLPPTSHVLPDGTETHVEHGKTLRVRVRPDAPIQILLTGHYDTVFLKDCAFQEVREIDSDTWNGPGLTDMKGGLVIMREALLALNDHPDATNVGYTVLISPDEETGSTGSAGLLAAHAKNADLGLTYEPCLADGTLTGARKGSGNFSIVVHGRAVHAGREHSLGRNAIVVTAQAAQELAAMTGKRKGLTLNPARIDGGGPNNVVPELGILRFNVRVQETGDAQWFLSQLDDLVARLDAQDGFSVHLHGGLTRPPKPMAPPNARLFEMTKAAGKALGLNVNWQASGGVCEGNNLWAQGCPNVDSLGVRGGEIHSDREYVVLSSFAERCKLSALMMFKFASGEFDAKGLRKLAKEEV